LYGVVEPGAVRESESWSEFGRPASHKAWGSSVYQLDAILFGIIPRRAAARETLVGCFRILVDLHGVA
jgi:hypothetical protein